MNYILILLLLTTTIVCWWLTTFTSKIPKIYRMYFMKMKTLFYWTAIFVSFIVGYFIK